MPTKLRPASRFRALWKGVSEVLLQKAEKPCRLTAEDSRENYGYRLGDDPRGREDPLALFHRVRRGVKPMCTILLRHQKVLLVGERSIVVASERLGMRCVPFFTRGGKREAVVFQEGATLGHFYDPEDVIARYKGVDVTLDPALFNAPLEKFARGLIHEDFPVAIKYPLMGLCLGYPVQETIDLIKSKAAV